MNVPSPADLGAVNQRLAQNNARVAALMNSFPGLLGDLIAATDRRDWIEVTRQSESLAELGQGLKSELLFATARELAAVAESRSSDFEIKRKLLRVIGAAGQTRRTPFLTDR